MNTLKVVSFGIMAGIVVAATLLILFVTGAIDQDAMTGSLGQALAVIGIMVFAFLGIVAVTRLNQPDDSDK